jgi:hypothetical protein
MQYLLGENKVPYPLDTSDPANQIKWAIQTNDEESKRVDWTTLERGAFVSTIFLGWANPNPLNPEAPPMVFETILSWFDKDDIFARRYATWGEAQQGHKETVAQVKRFFRENGSRNQREGRYLDRIERKRVRTVKRLVKDLRHALNDVITQLTNQEAT